LSFSRFNDKLFWRRWEHIVICSIEDTLLWNANPAEKEEWLQKLLGDPYTSEYFKEKFIERKLTVESVENFELGSRNYLVVNYKGSTSYKNQKPCFSRGLVYVMKSPCDLWKGVIVFQLVDSKYGSPPIDSFSSTGALESFIGIVRSFTYIEKSQKKK